MVHKIQKQVIGQVERISLPELGLFDLYARIDTGARSAAIWASSAVEKDGKLEVVFLGPDHPSYTGEKVIFDTYEQKAVASSNGLVEIRYKVRTLFVINNRKIRARLTLTDRSKQVYPVLVGRNVLYGKFVVDVTKGTPLIKEEKRRTSELRDLRIFQKESTR